MNQQKRIVAIVCGGDSSEHDVSLRSAKNLYAAFDKQRYEVYLVDLKKGDWHVCLADGRQVPVDRNDFSFVVDDRRVHFDYAYITIHGTPGENGQLQGYFEMIDLPYSTSGVLVEAMTFDKFVLNQYLRSFGVTVADSLLIRRDDARQVDVQQVVERIGLPCFVKPASDGSSFGVSKVTEAGQLPAALENAFKQGADVMVEQFMDGTEITVGCYKTKQHTVVFPITEVVSDNEFFDYDAKYNGHGTEITPARLPEETAERASQLTSHIYDILHCNGIIRIDYIISKDQKIRMLEINTTPGMTDASFIPQQVRAAGLSLTDVLTEIVENQFA